MTNQEWREVIQREFHVNRNIAGYAYTKMLAAIRECRKPKEVGVWRKEEENGD